jgi:dTDP-4-amino-4,6-dideoxygalactose transaminase
MAALLAELEAGDEVIMPSYTFVSTANAFVLRGATPVFVDIRPDTLNLDERLIEEAISDRTRAIVPVHYAGVACEMDAIMAIANRRHLLVIEDAAQGLLSTYSGRPVGCIGDMGAVSFHETKNVISGEGGALVLRDGTFAARAEIIREKGTNRAAFFRGQVDKYTWVDIGSSYLPSELIAAFLWAQMQQAVALTARRLAIWARYHAAFEDLERDGLVRRPVVPSHCGHNAHMYYLLLSSLDARQGVLEELKALGIMAIFHYVPLHSAPAGRRYGRAYGELTVTDAVSTRLMRLPLWFGVEDRLDEIIDRVRSSIVRHTRVPMTTTGARAAF